MSYALRNAGFLQSFILGSEDDDILSGTRKNDSISGSGGNDLVLGRGGSDEIDGGSGDDIIFGGNGSDLISGNQGNDLLYGGNGDDVFVINSEDMGDSLATIMDFDVGRNLRRMEFSDRILLIDAEGLNVRFKQAGDDVELYFDMQLMAVFKGSEGGLLAEDLLLVVDLEDGNPTSIGVGEPIGDPLPLVFSTVGDAGAFDLLM